MVIRLRFFKEAWDIMSSDVTKAVQEFFINGKLLKELNHTIIALIPKVSSPSRINDYRPISCCNVLFKCISKIIANHIKESLKVLVSLNQSAFVPGRKILDNILLTFHHRMVAWIMECFTTTLFSISINGVLHGYFNGKRGLRQDDPLSPYLFTLIMEVLTLMLSRRVRDSELFTYHRYCLELEIVNLCFADDLFLFAHGDKNSARVIWRYVSPLKKDFSELDMFLKGGEPLILSYYNGPDSDDLVASYLLRKMSSLKAKQPKKPPPKKTRNVGKSKRTQLTTSSSTESPPSDNKDLPSTKLSPRSYHGALKDDPNMSKEQRETRGVFKNLGRALQNFARILKKGCR
ncbi:putative reverse transcriptase domain, reverse transcriptase zinc-binding domain protein [Tanacetum coccineum]